MAFKSVLLTIPILLLSACAGSGRAPFSSTPLTPVKIDLPRAKNQPTGRNQDYYDPNRTRVALYDTRGKSSMRLGPYFRVDEFNHSGGTVFPYARIDGKLVACLSRLRKTLGQSIRIESGYRSWAYNTQLFRQGRRAAKKSYHMSGKAADIAISGVSASDFARALYSNCGCGTGLGVAANWYHIDTRGSNVRPWGYGLSSKPRLHSARSVQKQVCGGGRDDFNELSAALIDSTMEILGDMNKSLDEIHRTLDELIK